jgi:hypothetical protein
VSIIKWIYMPEDGARKRTKKTIYQLLLCHGITG